MNNLLVSHQLQQGSQSHTSPATLEPQDKIQALETLARQAVALHIMEKTRMQHAVYRFINTNTT